MNWTRFYLTIFVLCFTSIGFYELIDPQTVWQRVFTILFGVVVNVGLGLCILFLYEKLYKMENIRNINKAGWTKKEKEETE